MNDKFTAKALINKLNDSNIHFDDICVQKPGIHSSMDIYIKIPVPYLSPSECFFYELLSFSSQASIDNILKAITNTHNKADIQFKSILNDRTILKTFIEYQITNRIYYEHKNELINDFSPRAASIFLYEKYKNAKDFVLDFENIDLEQLANVQIQTK